MGTGRGCVGKSLIFEKYWIQTVKGEYNGDQESFCCRRLPSADTGTGGNALPPHPITLSQSFSLYTSGTVRVPILRLHPLAGGWVGIRIKLFISMRIRIRIQGAKPMRIQADPDQTLSQKKFNFYMKNIL